MKNVFLIFLVLALIACESKPKVDPLTTEFSTVKTEVIAVHDVAMAQMGNIMKMKKMLVEQLDSTQLDSAYVLAITDLDNAHNGMMVWMRSFSDGFTAEQLTKGLNDQLVTEEEKENAQELINLMKDQKVTADIMNNAIEESIAKAKSLLSLESK
ncbi:MAG: hypothetical protein OCD76_20340 [Reichenbachiella sp.]